MADAAIGPRESLSSWWKVAALGTMAAGVAVLILLTAKAYQNAPPIPDRFVDPAGVVVFTADESHVKPFTPSSAQQLESARTAAPTVWSIGFPSSLSRRSSARLTGGIAAPTPRLIR